MTLGSGTESKQAPPDCPSFPFNQNSGTSMEKAFASFQARHFCGRRVGKTHTRSYTATTTTTTQPTKPTKPASPNQMGPKPSLTGATQKGSRSISDQTGRTHKKRGPSQPHKGQAGLAAGYRQAESHDKKQASTVGPNCRVRGQGQATRAGSRKKLDQSRRGSPEARGTLEQMEEK